MAFPAIGSVGFPEQFSAVLVEGAQLPVEIGRGDKHQPARGHDRSAVVFASRVFHPLGSEFRIFAERNFPGILARVQVDRVQCSPGRSDGGIAVGIQELVVAGETIPGFLGPVSRGEPCGEAERVPGEFSAPRARGSDNGWIWSFEKAGKEGILPLPLADHGGRSRLGCGARASPGARGIAAAIPPCYRDGIRRTGSDRASARSIAGRVFSQGSGPCNIVGVDIKQAGFGIERRRHPIPRRRRSREISLFLLRRLSGTNCPSLRNFANCSTAH